MEEMPARSSLAFALRERLHAHRTLTWPWRRRVGTMFCEQCTDAHMAAMVRKLVRSARREVQRPRGVGQVVHLHDEAQRWHISAGPVAEQNATGGSRTNGTGKMERRRA